MHLLVIGVRGELGMRKRQGWLGVFEELDPGSTPERSSEPNGRELRLYVHLFVHVAESFRGWGWNLDESPVDAGIVSLVYTPGCTAARPVI